MEKNIDEQEMNVRVQCAVDNFMQAMAVVRVWWLLLPASMVWTI